MPFKKTLTLNFVTILIFTLIYFTLSRIENEQFNGLDKNSSFLDHLYFTFTIQSTIGFGDIYPISPIAKVLVMIQQSLIILGVADILSEAGAVAPSVIQKMI